MTFFYIKSTIPVLLHTAEHGNADQETSNTMTGMFLYIFFGVNYTDFAF